MWVRGHLLDHGQLNSSYTTEENYSFPSFAVKSPSGRGGAYEPFPFPRWNIHQLDRRCVFTSTTATPCLEVSFMVFLPYLWLWHSSYLPHRNVPWASQRGGVCVWGGHKDFCGPEHPSHSSSGLWPVAIPYLDPLCLTSSIQNSFSVCTKESQYAGESLEAWTRGWRKAQTSESS